MKVSKRALVAAMVVAGPALMVSTPAAAQRQQQQAAQDPQQQMLQARFSAASRAEQAALQPLIAASVAANQAADAGQTPDWAAFDAALPAARAAARSNEAKYFVARAELDRALSTRNVAAQEQALAAILANPVLSPEEQTRYRTAQSALLNKRAEEAFAAQDFAAAERAYRQLQQANPGDQRIANNLRIVQERMGNTTGALQSLEQQISQAEAAGQRASEDLYNRAWQIPYRAGQRREALAGLERLVRAYPTPANWRVFLDLVRENSRQDTQYLLDTYRFARASDVMQRDEYLPLATSLNQAGLPGEVKAVIDAGASAGALQTSSPEVAQLLAPTVRRIAEDRAGLAGQIQQARAAANGREARIMGDVLYGYGRYDEAADMYRVALSKGGVDQNLLNTRLGASLALAGQKAEAEAALRAVTGPRSELAALWLAWLNRQG